MSHGFGQVRGTISLLLFSFICVHLRSYVVAFRFWDWGPFTVSCLATGRGLGGPFSVSRLPSPISPLAGGGGAFSVFRLPSYR